MKADIAGVGGMDKRFREFRIGRRAEYNALSGERVKSLSPPPTDVPELDSVIKIISGSFNNPFKVFFAVMK